MRNVEKYLLPDVEQALHSGISVSLSIERIASYG